MAKATANMAPTNGNVVDKVTIELNRREAELLVRILAHGILWDGTEIGTFAYNLYHKFPAESRLMQKPRFENPNEFLPEFVEVK